MRMLRLKIGKLAFKAKDVSIFVLGEYLHTRRTLIFNFLKCQ